jgi:hypothetical protein
MRAPDINLASDSYVSERWPQVEVLFNSLGLDANKLMVDMWPKDEPPMPLRETLVEIYAVWQKTPDWLKIPPTPSYAQVTRELKKTLQRTEALLGDFERQSQSRSLVPKWFYFTKNAEATKKALTAYAAELRDMIELVNAHPNENASKEERNGYWRELIRLWLLATAGAKKHPQRKRLFKFIFICAPAQFAPRSGDEIKDVIKRSLPQWKSFAGIRGKRS